MTQLHGPRETQDMSWAGDIALTQSYDGYSSEENRWGLFEPLN